MTTFTAIVCSHNRPDGLRSILGNLRYQTRPPDEVLAYVSDTPDLARFREQWPEVSFHACENRSDWGHEKRAHGLEAARGKWLGWFNDDDSYEPDYLEAMLAVTPGQDVVYCGWNEQPECGFHQGSSTAGNFIVRAALAKEVGWTGRHYEADGAFIDAVRGRTDRIVRIGRILYHHNVR